MGCERVTPSSIVNKTLGNWQGIDSQLAILRAKKKSYPPLQATLFPTKAKCTTLAAWLSSMRHHPDSEPNTPKGVAIVAKKRSARNLTKPTDRKHAVRRSSTKKASGLGPASHMPDKGHCTRSGLDVNPAESSCLPSVAQLLDRLVRDSACA